MPVFSHFGEGEAAYFGAFQPLLVGSQTCPVSRLRLTSPATRFVAIDYVSRNFQMLADLRSVSTAFRVFIDPY